jgi:hypothetical protein
MTRFATVILSGCLLLAGSARAAENWQALGFTTTPKNLPQLIAATDAFMASDAGKALPGTLSLLAAEIDGGDPATHSFISSMESFAAREKWVASLEGNADWIALRDAYFDLVQPGGTSRMVFVKSWGEGANDVVWHLFGLEVSDAAKYLGAMDALMASETGKKFPGSLYLSSVAAAGMSSVTHVVSVGYESEAEAEAWNDVMLQSADWATFQAATDPVSKNAGAWVLRTLKTWGTPPE